MNSDTFRQKILTASLFTAVILSGCEKTLDFNGKISGPKQTVGAFANPDSLFNVKLYRSFFFLYRPAYSDESYFIVPNATVDLNVNNGTHYTMTYNSSKKQYMSDYHPSEGDIIEISSSAPGMDNVEAKTKILSKSIFSITSVEKYYNKNPMVITKPYDAIGSDTLININFKITDTYSQKDYYRLVISSFGCDNMPTGSSSDFVYIQELFDSGDLIFYDRNITKSINYWPVNFSNIFNDDLFNGKEYAFTITTRQRDARYTWIEADLQHISEDMYKYLKSIQTEMCYDSDVTSEPVQIYTNVKNGLGILGSITCNKKTIKFY